jgi:hypothetical protein
VALWSYCATHPTVVVGGVATAAWAARRGASALLTLLAGLVAIFGSAQRSRAERAFEVLRAVLIDKRRK